MVLSKQEGKWQGWWENQDKILNLWKDSLSQFQPDKMMEFIGSKDQAAWQNCWTQDKMLNLWKDSFALFQPDKIMGLFGQDNNPWQEWWKPDKVLGFFNDKKDWFLPGKKNELYQEWFKTTTESIGEYIKWMPTGVGKETFDKVMQASGLYMQIYSFWGDLILKMSGKTDPVSWKEFSRTAMQQYNKVLDSFYMQYFPEPVKGFLKILSDTNNIYQDTFYNFFKPWLDASPDMQEKVAKILKGDREAYTDFLRTCSESYQDSYGKIFRMPAFGLSRESFERLTNSMDSYLNYITIVNEFFTSLYKKGYDALDKLMERAAGLSAEGKTPQSFKEFYQLWWQTNEEAYLDLFKTEGYAKMQGEMVNAWVNFKNRYDEWLMEFFGKLPVPTNKEMDSLYKSVYQLKKVVKDHSRKLEELNEKLEALKNERGGNL